MLAFVLISLRTMIYADLDLLFTFGRTRFLVTHCLYLPSCTTITRLSRM
jgi:hypothetical protein